MRSQGPITSPTLSLHQPLPTSLPSPHTHAATVHLLLNPPSLLYPSWRCSPTSASPHLPSHTLPSTHTLVDVPLLKPLFVPTLLAAPLHQPHPSCKRSSHTLSAETAPHKRQSCCSECHESWSLPAIETACCVTHPAHTCSDVHVLMHLLCLKCICVSCTLILQSLNC